MHENFCSYRQIHLERYSINPRPAHLDAITNLLIVVRRGFHILIPSQCGLRYFESIETAYPFGI